ncbi:SagB/ThcOx family dehydrogenase [Amycolatopsis mongoliensis]|uniref:SagB/ThcOx family dehydrogenase n=1 Tax=Amycolatopsis mongoliensis TaxID=715475 RepID=A0A9Y2JQF6_9PSEU|nr:SagB/ThcOx family dehydrogenase [Amycolatopsis sp. 4-36]WIY02288.1 SagB/ThcOx family dehydrogenase [Amycolatopsis sp. 4-36]
MPAYPPEGIPETVRLWSLTEDTLLEAGDDDTLVAITWWGEYELADIPRPVRESLGRMALGPISMGNLATSAGNAAEAWAGTLRRVLNQLSGSVVHSLALNDGRGPLLSAIPVTQAPVFPADVVPPGRLIKLSRYSAMRPDGGGLVLESPRARYRVALLRPPAVAVASSLAGPVTVAQVAETSGLTEAVVADVVTFLVAAGVVLVADDWAEFTEDTDTDLTVWSPDDLMFHARSRTWLKGGPPDPEAHRAGTEPPVVKQLTAGPTFPLHRPDPEVLKATDPTLATLLEHDHTCPEVTERALSADQVGEFLFRAARVRSIGPAYLPGGPGHEASQRPYFSVACLYELEIYVGINRCADLARGIYHYDPLWHTLTLINDDLGVLDGMLDLAMVGAGSHRRPSVLLTMTARMSRIAWVLGSAAYATTLVHVGALQQVLYLTAKAMGLAAHAVPVDAGDRVDRSLKLEWPAEVSVGECVLDFPGGNALG